MTVHFALQLVIFVALSIGTSVIGRMAEIRAGGSQRTQTLQTDGRYRQRIPLFVLKLGDEKGRGGSY